MIRSILIAAAGLLLVMGTATAAAPCKDPKTGKFIKCPPAKPAPTKRCRNAKGQFQKCGTPGAKPAPNAK